MSAAKGQAEKDKGNAAFKAGDYPTAVGYYSTAIVDDPMNPAYPLNRAAAYLKLGKNEDAERDCTKVLRLDGKNVKAMFRRGQARVALQKLEDARDDFQNALSIEPANNAVQIELNKVQNTLKAQSKLHPKKQPCDVPVPPLASSSATSSDVPKPKRRRIPIEIVEGPASPVEGAAAARARDDLMTPVSSRTPRSHLPTTSIRPITIQEAEGGSTRRPAVGGGIFRPSGQHTIFGEKNPAASPSVNRPLGSLATSIPTSQRKLVSPLPHEHRENSGMVKPPLSLFDFTKEWERFRSVEERWSLLNVVSPAALPTLFKSSLDASFLVQILSTLKDILNSRGDGEIRARVREYMTGMARVSRFSTVVLFLSSEERRIAEDIWRLLGSGEGWNAWTVS